MEIIDINEECGFPASHLSNFQPRSFLFDDVECNSMEGLLQSFKFEDPEKQKEICLLVGKKAKFKGKKKKWFLTQILWWKGQSIDRHSKEYQELLYKAFIAMSQNKEFCETLLATEHNKITHSIGKQDPYRTILTEDEFCSRLMWIRTNLQNKKDLN
jgi:hypothetical protein